MIVPMIRRLLEQSRRPDTIVISVTSNEDVPDDLKTCGTVRHIDDNIVIVVGQKGLCHQRNAALMALPSDWSVVVFYDDDYIPTRDALAGIQRGFAAFPDAGGLSGQTLADGISGPGLSVDEAESILSSDEACRNFSAEPRVIKDIGSLYGCNMAFRREAIDQIAFDERLPLYGWLEDVDFSVRAAGRKLFVDSMRGVHLGVKHGRSPGARLGYSQVANPTHLASKGIWSWRQAGLRIGRNLVANMTRSLAPEPWIDRKGRLKGNLLAFQDAIAGRLNPGRILETR